MSETILEKTEGRVSYHDSVEEMLKELERTECQISLTAMPFRRKFAANFV